MAFTEFYTNASTGANTSAGSTEGSPVTTLTGGSWVSTTGVFTKAGADLSGVSVGMFAAVMVDAGTVAAIIGRITAVDDTLDTVTISTTAKSGSLADQTATATLTVGGVWKGPNAAVAFPFGFITNALTDASGNYPRVNLKNNSTYAITAAMVHGNNGPTTFQGYTTTVGDGGKVTIDGGTSGASYVLLTLGSGGTGADNALIDMIFQNNGATGIAAGLDFTQSGNSALRVVVHAVRGNGIRGNSSGQRFTECEVYACNQSNGSNQAGFFAGGRPQYYVRCTSHDNVGNLSCGFIGGSNGTCYEDCVADSNGADGFSDGGSLTSSYYKGCDSYNNARDGLRLANPNISNFTIENCNFLKNGGYGINGSSAQPRHGHIANCGFGSGTQANTSGTTTGLSAMVESGSITYAADVTPWVDPANGDFRINLATAKGTGRGTFTQTAASYAGTVGYPDVGAAQHVDSGGGGGMVVPTQVLGTESEQMGT